jgi:glycosyltransferase involved in cell wall biosynthesis
MHRADHAIPGPHFSSGGGGDSAARVELSVVVPLYDEEGLVRILVDRLTRAIEALGIRAEVILVDDGSRDGTLAEIARAHRQDGRFVGIALSRNFGHQLAISAGLAHARGKSVVVMDGDLQDPPEAIGALRAKLQEGFDVVYAVRASRPEGRFKRLAYAAFYRVLNRLVAVEIPLDAGDFAIMSRRVVNHLVSMPERRRFLRGMRAWVGFRQTGLPIDRGSRLAGRPKYTFGKLCALALDGLVGFSDAPLRFAGAVGLGTLGLTALGIVWGITRGWMGYGWLTEWYWVSLLIAFFAGAQLLSSAIQAEYVGRILEQVHGRPLYVVRSRIGFRPANRTRRTQSRKKC